VVVRTTTRLKREYGMSNAYGIDKENFESYINEDLSEQITDEQWERVADEIHGRVNNFIDGLLEELVLDYEEGKGIFDEF
jgi:endonuclease III